MQQEKEQLLAYYDAIDEAGKQYILEMASFLAAKSTLHKSKSLGFKLIIGTAVDSRSSSERVHCSLAAVRR